MVSEAIAKPEMREYAQAHEGNQWVLVGMPRMGRFHEDRQRGCWILRESDCDVPHRLGIGICLYV
jgi:hypothetical protein